MKTFECLRFFNWKLDELISPYLCHDALFFVYIYCNMHFFTLLPPANEVWGKVIFWYLFVSLFTGWGMPQCMLGYHPQDQASPPGTMHPPRTMHPSRPCTPPDHAPSRIMHPPRNHAPPGAEHAGRYRQCTGGTHRTLMQSCCIYYFCLFLTKNVGQH